MYTPNRSELNKLNEWPGKNVGLLPSAFSKTSLNIRKFMVYVFLKPGLENFKHYFTNM